MKTFGWSALAASGFGILCASAQATPSAIPAPQERALKPKVVVVVLDGVRALELENRAHDDDGNAVSASSLFPNLFRIAKTGAFITGMKISNPAGKSLPAYADLMAGRRIGEIISNNPPEKELRAHGATIFDALETGAHLAPREMALIAAWKPICSISIPEGEASAKGFLRDCGPGPKSVKPEIYSNVRADMDSFASFDEAIRSQHPRFVFLHFSDGDSEAHYHRSFADKRGVYYGIFGYHQALQRYDYLVGRVWKKLQKDPFYRGQTYLLVTTDHGRDNFPDPNQWADHGECVKSGAKKLCSGCQRVFLVATGPGIRPYRGEKAYTHLAIAPTIAALFGTRMVSSGASPILEALPITNAPPKRDIRRNGRPGG